MHATSIARVGQGLGLKRRDGDVACGGFAESRERRPVVATMIISLDQRLRENAALPRSPSPLALVTTSRRH